MKLPILPKWEAAADDAIRVKLAEIEANPALNPALSPAKQSEAKWHLIYTWLANQALEEYKIEKGGKLPGSYLIMRDIHRLLLRYYPDLIVID